ncbi:MAG: aminotransferase class V-fold PLP-dependent enzyme [Deltaproteobacteria bacterium]|jgi:L-cysteine/cystine lyase|nr:aminotransferase class V-fold PLP-dependent enzyme [Deltaproteobacteria bacterium]MBW2537368.1 aminotransferase class V-fold PLP-dependent enzyme [Deltaproteobacteria bacterium]
MSRAEPWASELRSQIPLLGRVTYLNTGTAGPLPECVVDAMAAGVDWEREHGRGDFTQFGTVIADRHRARELVARLLGATADEIALCHHTSDGLNIVLSGIDWRPGDRLVTTTVEHDAGAVPVGMLARRYGVDVRFVEVDDGASVLDRMDRACDERARLVVVSHVAYSSGAALPVAELARLAHARGAWIVVDGAQSCGDMPIDVRELDADFYTLSGQKWLCGPEGTGALYVQRDRVEQLWPTFTSYFSAKGHDFRGSVELQPSARRFETGMIHRPALRGFVASLDWMLDRVGVERAWRRSRELVSRLRHELEPLAGVELVTPAECGSSLLSFDLPDFSPARLQVLALQLAREQGIIVRSIDHPPYALRASLGFFNTEAEVLRLVDAVRDAVARGPAAIDPADAWMSVPDHRE